MKKAILMAAVFALAACNGADTDEADQADASAEQAFVDGVDPNAEAGFEAVAPGNYEVVHADGSIDQLTISPGMLWSMVFADGTPAGGTIFMQGGKTCFVTEGEEGQACFSGTEPAEDGSIQSTAEDGEVMTVRPVDAFKDEAAASQT